MHASLSWRRVERAASLALFSTSSSRRPGQLPKAGLTAHGRDSAAAPIRRLLLSH